MNGNQTVKTEVLGVSAFATELLIADAAQKLTTNAIPVDSTTTQITMAPNAAANSSAVPATFDALPVPQPDPKPAWKRNYLGKRPRLSNDNMGRRDRHPKYIIPKNSLQLIHERFTAQEIVDREYPAANPTECFRHELFLNGLSFMGEGRSKKLAKLSAYDQAFKRLILDPNKDAILKIMQKAGKPSLLQTNDEQNDSGECKMESEPVQVPEAAPFETIGLYPAIMSFALHEYFTDYLAQSENSVIGYQTTPSTKPLVVPVKHQLKGAKKLPDNAHAMNPVALVHLMRPDAKFIEMDRDQSGNFVMKLELDGKTFISAATNKKSSKLQCSQLACESLFNICYPLTLV